jgi:hypothetical protein
MIGQPSANRTPTTEQQLTGPQRLPRLDALVSRNRRPTIRPPLPPPRTNVESWWSLKTAEIGSVRPRLQPRDPHRESRFSCTIDGEAMGFLSDGWHPCSTTQFYRAHESIDDTRSLMDFMFDSRQMPFGAKRR